MKWNVFVWGTLVCMVCVAGFDTSSVCAGKLDDFEKDATKPRRSSQHSHSDGDGLWDFFFEGLLGSLFETEYQESRGGRRLDVLENQPGDGLRPLVRFDFGYQNVESDVDAMDYRFEVGVDHLALQWRRTTYAETTPADDLDYDQGHVLFRFYDANFEIDFGLGYASLNGDTYHSGLSATIPVLIQAYDFLGFELRPSWSYIGRNSISDYDLSVTLGWDYAVCRLGYRWVRTDNEALDGPYVGLSLRF